MIRRSTRRRLAFDGEWDTGEGIGEDCRRGVGGRAGSSSSKQTAAAAAAVSKQARGGGGGGTKMGECVIQFGC